MLDCKENQMSWPNIYKKKVELLSRGFIAKVRSSDSYQEKNIRLTFSCFKSKRWWFTLAEFFPLRLYLVSPPVMISFVILHTFLYTHIRNFYQWGSISYQLIPISDIHFKSNVRIYQFVLNHSHVKVFFFCSYNYFFKDEVPKIYISR